MVTIATDDIDGNELWWLATGPGSWGSRPVDAQTAETSLRGHFVFAEETSKRAGLRTPQLGALHAILAYRSTEQTEAITIVLPTGTGKTETMLAAYCHSPARTLVMVPSDALRTQIATKFVALGKLPEFEAVVGDFRCPSVLVLTKAPLTEAAVDELVAPANVIVATAQVLATCSAKVRSRLAAACARLFVDEAHHEAARTWRAVVDEFIGKEVVQFTATPYREDGRHLSGKVEYAYPLRLAQKNDYFARIDYQSVVELGDPDRAVATAAVQRLRDDLAAGLDHLLMARAGSVARAKVLIKLYQEIAPDLAPIRLDRRVVAATREKRLTSLLDRTSRIVVCVNMLGEGFDLPELKVAAIHDPQKSLAVTLQFIGRFTRTGKESLGNASAFVPLQVAGIDERLRRLYGEDADWNEVIRDLTEHAVGGAKERSEFEKGFGTLPHEIAMRSIHPKMSTVTYQSSSPLSWTPERIYDLFEDRLLTTQLGINNAQSVVWWVSRETVPVRWGEFSSFNELVHHLYVVHVDDAGGFLYINSTNKGSMHEDIAQAIGGADVSLVNGETVYRILAKVQRRTPTNVGLLDSVSRNRRFSMYVGQDVLQAWKGDAATKMKTNIFAHGFHEGRVVSFGASRKGKVWSHEQARDIHDWVRWAREIGPAITDTSVSLDSVMAGFLLPHPATERPPHVPLAIEWPYQITATLSETRTVSYQSKSFSLLETEMRLTDHSETGPLRFQVVTSDWALDFEFVFHPDGPPDIIPLGDDGEVTTRNSTISLAAFLTQHGLLVTFADEVVLAEQGFLLKLDRGKYLYPKDDVETPSWNGINLRRESQGDERDPTSIQHRAIELLSAEADWDVIVDDDGTGELADIVCLRSHGEKLYVLLAHCKYSSKATPGARIGDLYDVCGQAMKMNRAKSMPEQLVRRLLKRERKRQKQGKNRLIKGDLKELAVLVNEARFRELDVTVAVVQPGMSASKASEDMLALLGATDRFLTETYQMRFRVLASI
ncbi:DEAD/DEAH box helicase family protein [Kribbella sandramycini]|uniref:DEAD/DEAH box helicase family protein n=1 Tax=Kribbella sandramycini TaxID=60450 RepID=A0A7Y4KZC8_9ACTN|nr:DEAD/DEAH box helicase family protein [Kribbella sandramycini]MBB6569459.1 superfamily II DNA or RNA helicase [Kribbella sandramycini]NOL40707.1 DEAD/DEAH box helicase family protein [Kribbella sandramycini]